MLSYSERMTEPHRGGVPYAQDEQGKVADPRTAARGLVYTCLSCEEMVTLKRGQVRRPYFSHRAGRCTSNPETIEHLAFKRMLRQALEEHQKFTARMRCPSCGAGSAVTYPLPGCEAQEEVGIGAYRADVAALRGGQVVVAFEVYVTHAISGEKASALSIPWFEVSGHSSLHDGVPCVNVLDTNIFSFRPCKKCGNSTTSYAEAELLKRQEREAALAAERAKEEAARQAAKARQAEEEKRFAAEREAQREEKRNQAKEQMALRQQLHGSFSGEDCPSCWVTPYSPTLANFRAPLLAYVSGIRLLFHVALFPEVQVCETSSGIYALREKALYRIQDDKAFYASAEIGPLFTALLNGEHAAFPEALPLIEQVLEAVETVEKRLAAERAKQAPIQPRLL